MKKKGMGWVMAQNIAIRDVGNKERFGTVGQALQRLSEAYKGKHVALEYTKQSGISLSVFVSVGDDGEIYETYHGQALVTPDLIEKYFGQ